MRVLSRMHGAVYSEHVLCRAKGHIPISELIRTWPRGTFASSAVHLNPLQNIRKSLSEDSNVILSPHAGGALVPLRTVVTMAAWLEIVVGAILVATVNVPLRLLFAVTTDGIAIPLARFAGIALVALGISCLPSKFSGPHRSAVLSLLIFNAGATILFAWVAITTMSRGFLLWPAVVLHAVIAALLSLFLTKKALPLSAPCKG